MKNLHLSKWKMYLTSFLLLILLIAGLKPIETEAFAGGTGTVASPYLISTPAEFLKIASSATSHYKLTNDIDMAGITFNGFGPGSQNWFNGSLDGSGFSIKNLNMDGAGGSFRGLFGGIYSNNTDYTGVKNLTIDSATLSNVTSYGGIISGYSSTYNAAYPVTIENVTVKNSMFTPNASSSGYIGGLIGAVANYTNFANVNTQITINIPNNNYASNYSYLGGITGSANNSNFTNVTTNGAIVIGRNYGATDRFIGGVTGAATSSNYNNVTNNQNITYFSSYAGTLSMIAGINGNGSSLTFTNVTNNGLITISNAGPITNVSGVFGSGGTVTYTNVLNTGGITVNNATTASDIGGVTGSGSSLIFNGGRNDGLLKLTTTSTISQVGGVIGSGTSNKMTTVVNSGNINLTANASAISSIGGIIGLSSNNTNIIYASDKLTNIGSITLKASLGVTQYIGGILGQLNGGGYFTNLLNAGDIALNNYTGSQSIGGIVGQFNSAGPYPNSNWQSNSDISTNSTYTSAHNNQFIGGLIGYFTHYNANSSLNNMAASGSLTTTGPLTDKSRYIGGAIGHATTGYTSGAPINNVYSNVNMTIHSPDNTNTQYFPAGLVGFNANSNVNNSLALGSITSSVFYNDFSYSNFTNTNIRKINTLTGSNMHATNISDAQSKAMATYTGLGWSTTDWAIKEGQEPPYLKNLNLLVTNITKPTEGQSFQVVNIPFDWEDNAENATLRYSIKVEKQAPSTSTWTNVNTFTSDVSSYDFTVPNGTAGNTKFRYQVASVNGNNVVGSYSDFVTFNFTNNKPVVTGSFTAAEKDMTVSLEKRIMNFKVNTIVDPDTFNFVKLFAEIEGVAGSKQQLGTNIVGPVSWSAKNYKLKVFPKFTSSSSTFDVKVVDAGNENTVIATLITDKLMQNPSTLTPEAFKLKVYAEDYQNSLGTVLSTSNALEQAFTVDTRNYLPRVFAVNHDVNGRIMSANQGFNRIKFSGSVDDSDPMDGMSVHYSVKLKTDMVAGKYVVNPGTDTLISSYPANSTGVGTVGSFNSTYTIPNNLNNGDYVLLVYAKDTQGGIGNPVIINFTVNKTNPDIKFFANYDGQILSTPERKIIAKDSKLKMYFSAYDFTTFEYAGYLVRAANQTASGSYEDLKIRGAFTNDVTSQFIGVDLTDTYFTKGDMLVFKYRAISSTGVKIEKTVRVLIGDQNDTLAKLADNKVPTPLLISN